ncbi:MAG: ABC transporter permease [Oscillospiraceae bacterium]|nr:ABC transporter permease [Oscillospiraceae bacterium]
MNQVLRKRFLRDLKHNFGRYFALTMLIALGIYMIVGIVGMSEIVLQGTENQKNITLVEDGQFTVFLPLSESEISRLSENDTVIEEMFYTDLQAEDGSKLRMMKNRTDIDLIALDEGRLAETSGEAVLEKRYAAVHGLHCGDTVTAGGTTFTITGIGSSPDYDQPIASFSDVAVESYQFGLIFVTPEQYQNIRETTSLKAEEYLYAYRLGEGMTNEKLKEKIKNFDFDYTKVKDKYFRQTIDEILDKKQEMKDGIGELYDGSQELSDGLAELENYGTDLSEGANQLLDAYLKQAEMTLASLGKEVTLTKDNYAEEIDKAVEELDYRSLRELKESLDGVKAFADGMNEYKDGVGEAFSGSQELSDGVNELRKETNKLLDEIFEIDIDNLITFIPAGDNIRIGAAAGDVIMNKNVGLIAGLVILILFTYVISVFVIHQIEKEAPVIGALYSLGVKKKDLLLHYITLPVVIAFIGGVTGMIAGFSPAGIDVLASSTYEYYSVPKFPMIYPVYLIIYSVILPPVISAVVNTIVINQKLSQTALSLIKNEQKASSYRQFNLKSKNFIRVFQIRQMLREYRSAVAVIAGMLVCMLLSNISLDCAVMCQAVKTDNLADTHYEYMYLYKYPEDSVPAGGESAYLETLTIPCYDYTLDVSVIGLNPNSRYFEARPAKSQNKIIINNSLQERFRLNPGDTFTLNNATGDMSYTFTVDAVAQYSVGFAVFMDIDSMRELFGQEDDYFNAVYADKALSVEEGRLYSVMTKADVEKSAGVFVDMMFPMVITLLSVSLLIFCVVMYLMMGVMIDRSASGISLMKIFGYRANEIRKLYLNGNTLVIALGALICIPVSKVIMDAMYPSFIANVACGMKIAFPWYLYIGIYAVIMISYFIINFMLIGKINKISPAEVLKNRE